MNRHFPEYSPKLIPVARMLRKRMTGAEKKLWAHVRGSQLGIKFRRQVPFGPYIADFYCAKAKLEIELDGNQHYTQESLAADHKRDEYFAALSIKVVRYRNRDVMTNIDGIIADILHNVRSNEASSITSKPPDNQEVDLDKDI